MGQSVLKGACALDQVGDEIVYPRTLFMGVTLGIFLTFPKAQSKDLVRSVSDTRRISFTKPGWSSSIGTILS
jgi:hypothetical protein